MKKIYCCLLVLATLHTAALSQSVTPSTFNTTGGTNFFTFYRFEWSFGEATAVETMSNTNANLQVTNGILQPYTNNPATTYPGQPWDKEEIKVLPNPVRNVLEIDFFSKNKGKVTMQLVDGSGRMLATRQFDYYGTGRIEKWDLTRYPAGAYFLNIMLQPVNNGILAKKGAFKIIKVN
jgi:hypothetical protein